jgi:hypothetical protein
MATTTRKTPDKPCPEFRQVQDYARKYHGIATDDPSAFDVFTIWTMGTWTFSDGCAARPYTYPYIHTTGTFGSGKSVLARDVFGSICRLPEKITGITGPAMFQLIGEFDQETREVTNRFPTLLIDEVDATFHGAANEPLRGALNEGYAQGATIPRTMGKTGTIRFPVFTPKVLIGANNGRLPESVTQRTIRIDVVKHSQDELNAMGVQPMYPWETDDEQAEISQVLSGWAKENAMVLRDYKPDAPKGLTARQWLIARPLVQLARAAGVENRIVKALVDLFAREPEEIDSRTIMYTAIFEVFEDNDTTKATTRMLLDKLREAGIGVPGGSGKGLASVLSGDGIQPTYLRIDKPEHPGYVEGKTTHRGYHRYQFDQAFVDFLPDLDDDDDE